MVVIPCERVGETSPFRCQASAAQGQCFNKRTPNSQYCPIHGGTQQEQEFIKARAKKYKLQQWQEARFNEFSSDDDIKNLREEIGLLRTLLELLLGQITESGKFVLYADKIQMLVSQIRKTVEATHVMETKTQNLIDRRIVVAIAGSAIRIVAAYITEVPVQVELSKKIYASIDLAVTSGQAVSEAYDHEKEKIYSLAKYRLKQHGERVAQFACDDDIKNIRGEIAISRMTLEDIWNSCTNTNKLLLQIDRVQQSVGQIQKLIESAQRMEEKTNTLIDKKIVVVIADSIVNIVSTYVKDPDALTDIAERLCASIANADVRPDAVGTVA